MGVEKRYSITFTCDYCWRQAGEVWTKYPDQTPPPSGWREMGYQRVFCSRECWVKYATDRAEQEWA